MPKDNLTSDPVSIAERDVLAERRRQVEKEGWDTAHDDKHTSGSLALAAASYAAYAGAEALRADTQPQKSRASEYQFVASQILWPFDREWWKPKDPRRDLVRAAALLIAEIERIDRHDNRIPHPDQYGWECPD